MFAENRSRSTNRSGLILLALAWILFSIAAIGFARQNLSAPGLYYDEAVFGGLAKDFITGHDRLHTPGFELVTIFGRPFPVFVQFYLGALKSWTLIPALALFGPSTAVLRLTSLMWALLALFFLMIGVRRCLGLRAALIAGVVLISDPAYFFLSVLDWGAAISSLFCRCVAFYLAVIWWEKRRAGWLFLSAFFLGLGVFNKVDFVAFFIGGGIAAFCFYGRALWAIFRARPPLLLAGVSGFLLGTGPMIFHLGHVVTFTASGQNSAGPNELSEKLHTLGAMYDGSYFYRLMREGGIFSRMYTHSAGFHSLFPLILLLVITLLVATAILGRNKEQRTASGFLLLGFVLTTVIVVLIPGAVRIHHAILAFPFPQLMIAACSSFLWDHSWRHATLRVVRVAICTVIILLVASQLRTISKTEDLINRTGGRGRWSNSFDRFCLKNRNRADLTIISLDWGFNEQLAFLTDAPKLVEPFWALATRETLPPLPNKSENIYLTHSPDYSLYGYDVSYLEAARADPRATVQPYNDGEGRVVFYTIRFPAQ